MASSKILYKKVTIVGVGMMGGSLGLALRKKGLTKEVAGWGRNERRLRAARQQGAITSWTHDFRQALAGSELIVFATPMPVTRRLAAEWFPAVPKGCLITDLGSVKGGNVSELTELSPPECGYASSHPLCGLEMSGVSAADPDLFEGRLCILTPVPKTKKRALSEVQKLWQALGMRVISVAPARHDRIVASVSHLPHLLAAALVNRVSDEKLTGYVGTGFMDATRIAASEPGLWTGIVGQNRKEILRELNEYIKSLNSLKKIIEGEGEAKLKSWLQKASLRRKKLPSARKSN